jgi:hypothetical protein
VVVLAVLDIVVLGLGYRARGGNLPPLQRTSPSFPVPTATATGEADGVEEDGITGPLFLGVNAEGLVLRATRGACEERSGGPTRVSVGNVDDVGAGIELQDVTVPDVREVLGLMVYADGKLRVSGLAEGCDPITVDSTDQGATWTPVDIAGIWRLPQDTTAGTVTGPGGSSLSIGCPAGQIVNLPGKRAVASCESTAFYAMAVGVPAQSLQAAGFSQLSVTPAPDEGRYYAFGTTQGCGAQVGEVNPEAQAIDDLECLGDGRAPLAIAAAGDVVVLQVGASAVVSDDGGENFSPELPDLDEATS